MAITHRRLPNTSPLNRKKDTASSFRTFYSLPRLPLGENDSVQSFLGQNIRNNEALVGLSSDVEKSSLVQTSSCGVCNGVEHVAMETPITDTQIDFHQCSNAPLTAEKDDDPFKSVRRKLFHESGSRPSEKAPHRCRCRFSDRLCRCCLITPKMARSIMLLIWAVNMVAIVIFVAQDGDDPGSGSFNPISASLRKLKRNTPSPFSDQINNAPQCHKIKAEDISYTLVIHSPVEMLWMMGNHCKRWGRYNMISLSVSTDHDFEEVLDLITSKRIGCMRHQVTVSTIPNSQLLHDEYPIIDLRNLALSKVKTSHAVYVDIDFWIGNDLHDILDQDLVREQFAADPKFAAVLPAFEISGKCSREGDCVMTDFESIMPRSKDDVLKLVSLKKIVPFGQRFDKTGVAIDNSWIEQRWGTFMNVDCFLSLNYEPYLIFRYCDELPPFQKAFEGLAGSKIAWLTHLRRSGYLISQLGGAFVAHYSDKAQKLKWKCDYILPYLGRVSWTNSQTTGFIPFGKSKSELIFDQFKKWLHANISDQSRMNCDDLANEASMWLHTTR